MNIALLAGLTIPFFGTVLGASLVWFIKGKMSPALNKSLLGFASGVMVAASVWSLLLPAVEMAGGEDNPYAVIPAVIGLALGMIFLLYIDKLTPHLHPGSDTPEGPRSGLSRTAMTSLAVTIHNLPEGMAVGVVLAGLLDHSPDLSAAGAIAISVGIAIQNIPEGAIVSLPMHAGGATRAKSFAIGALSGIVEPIGAAIVILLAGLISPVIPYVLSFAAGAMLYVVIEDLIPEASREPHSNHNAIGFMLGFILMMVLDMTLG